MPVHFPRLTVGFPPHLGDLLVQVRPWSRFFISSTFIFTRPVLLDYTDSCHIVTHPHINACWRVILAFVNVEKLMCQICMCYLNIPLHVTCKTATFTLSPYVSGTHSY